MTKANNMHCYKYTAIDRAGQLIRGTAQAESIGLALLILGGLTILTIEGLS